MQMKLNILLIFITANKLENAMTDEKHAHLLAICEQCISLHLHVLCLI